MEEYLDNFDLCLAVERALINVGVAAWQIREDDPDLYDQMKVFQLAIALRNRLAHGYDEDINDDLIWITVSNSIPDLLSEVQSRLQEL